MTAAFSRRRPWKGLAVGVTLLFCGASACTGSGSDDAPIIAPTSSTSSSTPAPTTTSTAPKYTYPMTGLTASSAAAARRPTVAVPVRLSGSGHALGLQVADLVYVSFPNSSSVRALALFQSATSALVGPVAQTRPVDAKVLPVANAGPGL